MKKQKIYAEVLEQSALDQFNAAMALPCVLQGALMPDAHTGYSLPIGAVVKTKDHVFPGFVGYDIGCGVACLELAINYKEVDLEKLKDHILATIPIGFNGHTNPVTKKETFNFTGTSQVLQDVFSKKGTAQLGTLGGGNHFIEVGYLESNENIAIVIHSGSRGFGHGVASHYMQEAASLSAESGWKQEKFKVIEVFREKSKNWLENLYNATPSKQNDIAQDRYTKAELDYVAKQKAAYMKKQDIEGLHSFELASPMGRQYMADQNFCLDYAVANRTTMLRQITNGILDQIPADQDIKLGHKINRNHNHAELVDGSIIHRKGATHAEEGMMGVIPGNMRDGSFIVRGKGNPDSMCSSSHGAGRVLSRKKATATLSLEDFHKETAKLVSNHTDEMLDEAPDAYKNIFEVMKLQSDLVDVVDRVIPILNIKG